MRTTRLLALLGMAAMTCGVAAAQENCPLQPKSVMEQASEIAVSIQNTSAQPIASYRLGMTALTVSGHAHHLPGEFSDNVQLPANGKRTAIWQTPLAHQFALPLAQVYLLEATFADGTDWIDDGSHACAVTSVQE